MFNIIARQRNYDLKYYLEQPLVANNVNVYQFLLLKESIKEWEDTLSGEIVRFVCFSNATNGSSYEVMLNDGGTGFEEYYKCLVPSSVLRRAGVLYFTITVKDNTTVYRTHELTVPPNIYESGQVGTTVSIGDDSTLAMILQNLIGGSQGQALSKNSETNYDFEWTNKITAAEANKLATPRTIKFSKLIEGEGQFDGSQDINIPITTLNLNSNEFNITGKLPESVLPDSLIGQMLYGGTIDGSTGIITYSEGAKIRLQTEEPTYDTINGILNNAEGMYFITKVNGDKPILLEKGDWLLVNSNEWTRIDNTDAVVSVRGAADTPEQAQQGLVVLSSKNIGSASGNLEHELENGYSANAADKLFIPHSIDGINFDGSKDISRFFIVETAGNQSNKEAINDNIDYKLVDNSIIYVQFKSSNEANNITLNINNTGAKPICIKDKQIGTIDIPSNSIQGNHIYPIVYINDKYILCSGVDTSPTQISSIRETSILQSNETEIDIPISIYSVGGYESKLLLFIDGELQSPSNYNINKETRKITNLTPIDKNRFIDFILYISETIIVPTKLSDLEDTSEVTPINKAQKASELASIVKINISDAEGINTSEQIDFNGTKNVTLKLPENIKSDIQGNSDTTSKLKTPIKIGNANFDGSKSISLTEIGATNKINYNSSLSTSAWVDFEQTIAIEGVTSDNTIIVGPSIASEFEWNRNRVRCIEQGDNILKFSCSTVPTNKIDILITILT